MTGVLAIPAPADRLEVLSNVVSVLLVPHSKWYVVASPFGFTSPLRTAPTVVTDVAGFVTTVGASVFVVVEAVRPLDVPAALVATTR